MTPRAETIIPTMSRTAPGRELCGAARQATPSRWVTEPGRTGAPLTEDRTC